MKSLSEGALEKAALQKKLERERGIAQERKRSIIEKFSFRKMPEWVKMGPYLIELGLFVLFAIILWNALTIHAEWTSSDTWQLLPLIPIGLWIMYVHEIEDGWGKRWEYKLEIPEGDRKINYDEYWKGVEKDYIFSDSSVEYYSYQASKIFFGLITILFGIGVVLWFWVTSLSPSFDQFYQLSFADRAIIVLLAGIFFVLLSIGIKLRKR